MQALESRLFGLCRVILDSQDGLGGFSTQNDADDNQKVRRVCDDVLFHYSEPHRRYHTLAHIAQCLEEFDMIRDFVRNPQALEFAIWMHDIIYTPQHNDNEVKSADLASMYLGILTSRPDDMSRDVFALIMETEYLAPYRAAEKTIDQKLIADIDLSILGKDDASFDVYERRIREEYSHLSDELYIGGRIKFLQHLLSRPRIFQTSVFHHLYENRARKNIQRSSERLVQKK